ncbi:hypothetical protein AB0E08_03665 [Streptomyces sp. NPDC048281]|uniref:hypothetical protein n=1 Tax=Streptomyces sp. NPDC048281 TaxID=3154715 RepID=UPI00343245BC
MGVEWIAYRVWFPSPTEQEPTRVVFMEVSAHPLRRTATIKHQVWLLLSQKGHDLDPTEGGIEAIGTDTVTQGEEQ